MHGCSEVVSPSWFKDEDNKYSTEANDIWLSQNLRDHHLDGSLIMKEELEQSRQAASRPFASPVNDEKVEQKRRE